MKEKLKLFLKKKGWYYRLRFSYPFLLYQRLMRPAVQTEKKREIAFYRSFLKDCRLVFDIGAYDGHKTDAFLEFSRSVVCCEPDQDNYQLLQTRFRHQKNRVILENKALSDHEGKAAFYLHHGGSAFNTLNPKWRNLLEQDHLQKWNETISFSDRILEVSLTTLDKLIGKYGLPDFIKIDVEGYEHWVLKGLTQKIPFLTFEAMLPDCKEELLQCLARLDEISGINLYNVAVNEELLFENFVNREELNTWIDNTRVHHFEIAVKMLG